MEILKSSIPNIINICGVVWNKRMRDGIASLSGIVEVKESRNESLQVTKTSEAKLDDLLPLIKEIVEKG